MVTTNRFFTRSIAGLSLALALVGCSDSTSNGPGSADTPLPFGEAHTVSTDILQTKGVAEWELTISELVEDVGNPTDTPLVNVKFNAIALLAASEQLPVTTLESFDFSISGGSTSIEYVWTEDDCPGGGDFNRIMLVDAGEVVEGAVCFQIAPEDLEHPDTRITLSFNLNDQLFFGEVGAPAS